MRTFDYLTTEYIDFENKEKALTFYKKKSAKNGDYKIKRQGDTLRGHLGRLYEDEDYNTNKYEEGACFLYHTEWGWTLKLVIHFER